MEGSREVYVRILGILSTVKGVDQWGGSQRRWACSRGGVAPRLREQGKPRHRDGHAHGANTTREDDVDRSVRTTDFERDEARAGNRGGFTFLLVHGLASLLAGALTFVLPVGTAALVFMFQGIVAFPVSLGLERSFGYRMVTRENTLQPLFIQVASIQLLALPAVIVAYALDPLYTPVAFAAVGGAQFLPYTWLQRTPIYGVLAVVVAVSPYLLLGLGASWVFHATGFIIGGALLAASAAVWTTAPRRQAAAGPMVGPLRAGHSR